jgi:uncharacterized membrane protein YtjA (UPF0391 family)
MLRWSFLLFVLALVEGGLSHNHPREGSALIATVSFIAATSLFILSQLMGYDNSHDERKA